MSKKLVLLIDDEQLPMRYYVRALERACFRVERVRNPDDALDFVRTRGDEIGAIVLDIMMCPGRAYGELDTNEGLNTGVFLYRDIVRLLPYVPVVVLTNISDKETLRLFPHVRNIEIAQKLDLPPAELPELVNRMMNYA